MGLKVEVKKIIGDFSLDVRFQSEASRIGILGASGCGKSMTLRCIAGIESPDAGVIEVNETILCDSDRGIHLRPQKRNIGYLFQNYALFPAMTVAKNIEMGLKGTKQEKARRVGEMIRTFQLEGLEGRLPGELSGGQQQRVALARIMAYEPDVILLDEPFSALDMFLKDQLQQEMMEMLSDYRGIVILVSHSRDEIYRFSEELVVMEQGRVVTAGRTRDIFADPKKKEAARLTGCKNFSGIRRLDAHHLEALDWGIELELEREIPEDITCVGFRAHAFLPVWKERRKNCIRVSLAGSAELPFEKIFYLRPEGDTDSQAEEDRLQEVCRDKDILSKGNMQDTKPSQKICWILQKDKWQMLEENGMPDFLQFQEEQMLLLT